MNMKKMIGVFALVFLLAVSLGSAVYAADAGVGVVPGEAMPDFTVSLTDGTSATLSGILKEKDLVVLNIFATWCVPCEVEFPEMEKVYEANRDRMEILSVSGDPGDTMEMIADYKAGHGLTFPMGLAGGALDFLTVPGYPTSIFIDRSGAVGLVKVGAFVTEGDFEAKADYFLSPDYSGDSLGSERAVSLAPYILGYLGISALLMVIGRWGILRKAGRKGWHSLVPFLSIYEEYAAVWNGWFGVLAGICLPVRVICSLAGLPAAVSYILLFVRLLVGILEGLRLAKAFGKGRVFGVLSALPVFRDILRLVLGLGRAAYRPTASEA